MPARIGRCCPVEGALVSSAARTPTEATRPIKQAITIRRFIEVSFGWFDIG